jgi:toxin ParE1/3/4
VSGYEVHPEVANDVSNIAEFIARNTSLDAAARIVDGILEAMAMLGESPGIGHRREGLATRPLRFWAVYD